MTRLQKCFDELVAVRGRSKAPSKGGPGGMSDEVVAKVVQMILEEAVRTRASDIHMEPMEQYVRVRFRIDGLLEEQLRIPGSLEINLVSCVRVLCGLDPEQNVTISKPQDARMQARINKLEQELRLSTFHTPDGDKLVLRLIHHGVSGSLGQCGQGKCIAVEIFTLECKKDRTCLNVATICRN